MRKIKIILSVFLFGLLIPVMSFAALVGSWNFNEGAGNVVNDSSPYNNSGTIIGGVSWVPGKIATGLSFAGNGQQYVSIPPSSSLDISNAITLMAWVKFDDINGPKSIIFKGSNTSSATTRNYFLKKWDNGANFGVELGGLTGGTYTQETFFNNTPVVVGQWIHIAVTYNGSVVQFYYNGMPDGTHPASGTLFLNPADNLAIGQLTQWGAQNFAGTIDEVKIYNNALSAQEISTLVASSPNLMTVSFNSNNLTSSVIGAEPPAEISYSPHITVQGPSDPNTYTACFAGNLTTPYQFNGVNVYLSDPTCIGSDSLATGSATFTNFVCPSSGCVDPALQCVTYQLGNNGIENMQSLGVVHVTVGP